MSTDVVAVVDCGRARWKARTFSIGSGPMLALDAAQFEVGAVADHNSIQAVADLARSWIAEHDADAVVAVGAEAFRQDSELVATAERALGVAIRVLAPAEEGLIFAEAVAHACAGRDSFAVDIGGGSVQFVQLAPPGLLASAPLGTHSIEARWNLPQGSDAHRYQGARAEISELILEVLPSTVAQRVVAGSNSFARFFAGVAAYLRGVPAATDPAVVDGISVALDIDQIEAAYLAFQTLPNTQFASVMPSSPGFMYGADKALLVLLATMEATGATIAAGTDVGLAHGLALRVSSGTAL